MKQKVYQIHIPAPCSENWDTMTPVEKGRFCAACQKTVIDFTYKSDEEIIRFFQNKKDNVCGGFSANQLDRNMTIPPKDKLKWGKKWLAAFLLLFSSKWQINAQNNRPATQIILQDDSLFTEDKAKNTREILTSSIKNHQIKGRIVDFSTQQAVPSQLVFISNTNVGVHTDKNGNFELDVPDSLLNNKDMLALKCIRQDIEPLKEYEEQIIEEKVVIRGAISVVSEVVYFPIKRRYLRTEVRLLTRYYPAFPFLFFLFL